MINIIATIGPSSDNPLTLQRMKNSGMTHARINLSHTDLEYVKRLLPICNELDIPLIIDTEGAQVRSGDLKKSVIILEEGATIKIHNNPIPGDSQNLHLWPIGVVENLNLGDLISIDFDSVLLSVTNNNTLSQGYVEAKVINSGICGKNKSVVVQDAHGTKLSLPVLSELDKNVINYAIKNGVTYVAASFMNSGGDVDHVRKFVGSDVKIISKIESKQALNNIVEILERSDMGLIDRGDLSKEISIEKIPLTQKIILRNGQKIQTPVYVATNLLESMFVNKKPTRAEVNDIINTILDGASGLVLAGETAAGKYPVECIKMLKKLIKQSEFVTDIDTSVGDHIIERLENLDYLEGEIAGNLVQPHGGKLVNRMTKSVIAESYLASLPKITISDEIYMDAEQIAIGTFSPLEGFMGKDDLNSVLDNMRLCSGEVWTIPIVLHTSNVSHIQEGQDTALTDSRGDIVATIRVSEIFKYDKEASAKKLFGTLNSQHPGVNKWLAQGDYLIGGKITLVKRKESPYKQYELTPAQTRKIFEEKDWSSIIGFHTRNVIHKGHEYIQLSSLNKEKCDGLFVHPVIGKKKLGDYNASYIIQSYELMLDKHYPKGQIIFGTFSTYSRYAGPREAIFTAICRKNFGCSHFIVGRDHTGVKDFYDPSASHNIFDKFPDLGIKPVKFNRVFYSASKQDHIHEDDSPNHPEDDKKHISGTEARKLLESGQKPPEWYMRSEISEMLISAMDKKEKVFED